MQIKVAFKYANSRNTRECTKSTISQVFALAAISSARFRPTVVYLYFPVQWSPFTKKLVTTDATVLRNLNFLAHI